MTKPRSKKDLVTAIIAKMREEAIDMANDYDGDVKIEHMFLAGYKSAISDVMQFSIELADVHPELYGDISQ